MNIPENLLYTKTHEWVEFLSDANARVGLTDHAQQALGDLVFVGLPAVGDELTAGESLGDVESVKAVSEVNAPVSGAVSAVNEALLDAPEQINEDAYGAWLVEIENVGERIELLSPAEYGAFCAEEE